MKCDRCREWIHDRVDGRLSRSDARLLDDHLAHCRDCRVFDRYMSIVIEELDRLRELSDIEYGTCAAPVPVLPGSDRAAGRIAGLRTAFARLAAAVALVVIGGALAHRLLNDSERPDERLVDAPSPTVPTGAQDAPGAPARQAPRIVTDARRPTVADVPTIVLNGSTVDRYIPVLRPTSDPTVHVVWLHAVEVSGESTGESGMRNGSPAPHDRVSPVVAETGLCLGNVGPGPAIAGTGRPNHDFATCSARDRTSVRGRPHRTRPSCQASSSRKETPSCLPFV